MQSNAAKSDAELTNRVWAIINALPQREAIKEDDARAWVSEVVGVHGEQATWHATRSGGFGGSQIGALVRNHLGQRADHGASAHDIVGLSLLRKLPDAPNGPMRRGVAMEPLHRDHFLAKYGAARDNDGLDALTKGRGPRVWMRYSPDDLVFMRDATGKIGRFLVDYKSPTEVDFVQKVSFQYAAQLHMGRLVLLENNIPVSGMVLSQFNWSDWDLKDDEVTHSAEMDAAIVAAGDHFWDYVMRGELPAYVKAPRMDVPDSIKTLGDLPSRYARLKAIHTAIGAGVDEMSEQIRAQIKGVRFDGQALALDGLKVTASLVLDEEAVRKTVPAQKLDEMMQRAPKIGGRAAYDSDEMAKFLRQQGHDMGRFLKPAGCDNEALYALLMEEGYDADSMLREQPRMTVDRPVAAAAKEFVAREFHELMAPAQAASAPTNDCQAPEQPRYARQSVSA